MSTVGAYRASVTSTQRSEPMTLRLRGITKTYGALRANDGIDLDVAAGELHGLAR